MSIDRYDIAVSLALLIEPTLVKKGAVTPNNSYNNKNFNQFLFCSGVASNIIKDVHINPFVQLKKVIYVNEEILGYNRMWGAMELIFPYAGALFRGLSFINYLENYTTKDDVTLFNQARIKTWETSKKKFKRNYKPIITNNMLEHFKIFQQRYSKIPLINTWCHQILNNLPIVEDFYNHYENKTFEEIFSSCIPHLWEEAREKHVNYTIGQLADYIAVSLFKLFYLRFNELGSN